MASSEAEPLQEPQPSHRVERARSFHEFEQAGWEDSGVVAKYDEQLSRVTTQSVESLLDAVGVHDGSRVLDVASGAGYIAAAAARRGADAFGIDFSAAQVELARRCHPDVRFEHADAEALPFEPDSFDAVVSGFGMCHLPEPGRALGEAFRVLRHGGRVAFTVWASPERAVAFGALYAAVRAHGTMDVGLPVGPNFFLFSDPEQCARALSDAGFVSHSCREVAQVWRVTDPDDLFDAFAGGSVRAAATLRAQTPQARQAIKSAMRDVVTGYGVGDWYEVPAPAVLATAVKP
jgi:ubiquinone/menaquinone biosynthesis C-methylase UbiE